jgi:hypothetical protein
MSALRSFLDHIRGSAPATDSNAPTEMPPTQAYPYGPPDNPQMPEIPKATRLPDIPEAPPEGFSKLPPGASMGPGGATDAGQVCSEPANPAQVSVENPEIDPYDIEQNYQVDAQTEETLAKIARGEMTADEAMSQAATEATTEVTGEATAEVAVEAGAETTVEGVAGEGLLAGAAPVAVPLAVGAGVFLAGESSVVSEDEEQAMLAESRRQQAARDAAAKSGTGDNTPTP